MEANRKYYETQEILTLKLAELEDLKKRMSELEKSGALQGTTVTRKSVVTT